MLVLGQIPPDVSCHELLSVMSSLFTRKRLCKRTPTRPFLRVVMHGEQATNWPTVVACGGGPADVDASV